MRPQSLLLVGAMAAVGGLALVIRKRDRKSPRSPDKAQVNDWENEGGAASNSQAHTQKGELT